MSDALEQRALAWVEPWPNGRHLLRTRHWLLELAPQGESGRLSGKRPRLPRCSLRAQFQWIYERISRDSGPGQPWDFAGP